MNRRNFLAAIGVAPLAFVPAAMAAYPKFDTHIPEGWDHSQLNVDLDLPTYRYGEIDIDAFMAAHPKANHFAVEITQYCRTHEDGVKQLCSKPNGRTLVAETDRRIVAIFA